MNKTSKSKTAKSGQTTTTKVEKKSKPATAQKSSTTTEGPKRASKKNNVMQAPILPPDDPSNPYSSRGLLVSIGFSRWEARKYDKKVSKEIADKHGADESVGRYTKRLWVKTPQSLKDVYSAIDRTYEAYMDETLPWSDAGCRLLPIANYLRFTDLMRQAQAEIEQKARDFAQEYGDSLLDVAKTELNGLFNEADYPPASEIADRFGMYQQYYPVPIADDFRVNLSTEHVEALRMKMEEDNRAAFEEALKETFGRMWDATSHMVKVLQSDKPKQAIKQVLVENTRDAVEHARRLNLTGSKKVVELGERILSELCRHEADALRNEDNTRETVLRQAEAITEELRVIVGIEPADPAETKKQADKIVSDMAAFMG